MIAAAPPPVDPDQARRAAEEILARPEYQPAAPSLLSRFVRWLLDQLSNDPPRTPDRAPAPTPWLVEVLALTVLVVLVALIGYALVKTLWRDGLWRRRPHRTDDDEVETEADPGPDDWAGLALELEAAGRWRDALWARYRATVGRLSGAGWLRSPPGASPRELSGSVDEALPAAGPPFGELTETFQTVWYGGVPIDGSGGALARSRSEAVVAVLDAVGSAPEPARDPDDDPDDPDDPDDVDGLDGLDGLDDLGGPDDPAGLDDPDAHGAPDDPGTPGGQGELDRYDGSPGGSGERRGDLPGGGSR